MELRDIDGVVFVKADDVVEYLRKDAESVRKHYGHSLATGIDSAANAIWYMTRPELDD
jgi:hypothetical protein